MGLQDKSSVVACVDVVGSVGPLDRGHRVTELDCLLMSPL